MFEPSSFVKEDDSTGEIEYELKPIVGYAKELAKETHFAIHKPTNSIVFNWDYSEYDQRDLTLDKDAYFFDDIKYEVDYLVDNFRKSDFVVVTKNGLAKRGIDLNNYNIFQGQKYDRSNANGGVTENKENNINETKTKMKRLRFKKPFNGMDNALKLIPESYKEDRKEFEMTDNNETYKVRWEGSLTEGKGIVLQEANQHFINEDMAKIKHLMGYNSKSTLGTLKGADRITENAKFDDIWSKSKSLVSEATKDNKKPVISEAKQELNNLEKGKLALWTKKAGFNEPTK